MPKNKDTGNVGESLATEYLEKKGYFIIHRNWKGNKCEIDIVARIKKTVVFVEVKTRKNQDYGWPEKAVNRQKIRHIARAANQYIAQYRIEDEIRFDIVSIISGTAEPEIYHIEDAFVP